MGPCPFGPRGGQGLGDATYEGSSLLSRLSPSGLREPAAGPEEIRLACQDYQQNGPWASGRSRLKALSSWSWAGQTISRPPR